MSSEYTLDLGGGCDGPYSLSVIDGALPDGRELNDADHSIERYLLEDGDFTFRIQIEDSGCTPSQSTDETFEMMVGIGPIVVVDVLQNGRSA